MSKKRLIDTNALEQVLFKRSEELAEENEQKLSGALRGAICFICQAPTVHAEVVVHCENCQHIHVLNTSEICAICDKTNFIFQTFGVDTREFGCTYGERRESEAGK